MKARAHVSYIYQNVFKQYANFIFFVAAERDVAPHPEATLPDLQAFMTLSPSTLLETLKTSLTVDQLRNFTVKLNERVPKNLPPKPSSSSRKREEERRRRSHAREGSNPKEIGKTDKKKLFVDNVRIR